MAKALDTTVLTLIAVHGFCERPVVGINPWMVGRTDWCFVMSSFVFLASGNLVFSLRSSPRDLLKKFHVNLLALETRNQNRQKHKQENRIR